MAYREATPEEIQLVSGYLKEQEDWQQIIEIARQLYGPAVYRVRTVLDHTYDPPRILELKAYNEEGKRLPYDFSLPFWKEHRIAAYIETYTHNRLKEREYWELEPTPEEREQIQKEAINCVLHSLYPELHDPYHQAFDVNSPPMRPFILLGENFIRLLIEE